MACTFEIYKDKRGQFRYRMRAANSEIIMSGQAYKSKASCKNGIASIRKNSKIDARYDRFKARNGKLHFNLKAANHQVIGVSQGYASTSGCTNCIKRIKSDAGRAKIVDLTK